MRLRFPLLLPFAMGTCLVTSLWAQEREVKQPQPAAIGVINDLDVTVTDLTEEKLNNPPKREIKFERLTEPLKRKLTKPDPKLFEQKYVARFDLELPDNGSYYAQVMARDVSVAQLSQLDERFLIAPDHASGPNSVSESFVRMIKALPTDGSPAKAEREFFANPETGVMLDFIPVWAPDQKPSRYSTWSFTILGSTPEQLELRCKALLTILDQGACRSIQLSIFKKREPLCVQLREQRKATEASLRTWNSVQEQMKSYANLTPDMLSGLRVQQLQLEVDLAGVKARIAACERLLAQPALKPERRSQIEDVKVSAEIEFSGFEARRTKSDEFIGKVTTKIDLLNKLSTIEDNRKAALDKVRAWEREIKKIDAAIHAYAPLPLVDNKVTVQPLEWTQ